MARGISSNLHYLLVARDVRSGKLEDLSRLISYCPRDDRRGKAVLFGSKTIAVSLEAVRSEDGNANGRAYAYATVICNIFVRV